MTWLAFLGAAWLLLGAVTAVVMVRRGHDVATWAMLGIVLGPVAPILAMGSIASETDAKPVVLTEGREGVGFLDIVAGVDGSAESVAALRSAVGLHGENLGRLVVAFVVPFDVEHDPDRMRPMLAATKAISPWEATTVELRGDPATALQSFAEEEDFDLIVVGARGRGRSASPLGSVATRLAAGSPVPVLIGPGQARTG
jgi:nucleotide-binding universal stress UspA family protein